METCIVFLSLRKSQEILTFLISYSLYVENIGASHLNYIWLSKKNLGHNFTPWKLCRILTAHFSSPCPQHSYLCILTYVVQTVKRLPTMWETRVQSPGQEDLLEKEMATHSTILVWKIPLTEKPGRLQFTGLQRVGHYWVTSFNFTFNLVKKAKIVLLTVLNFLIQLLSFLRFYF